MSHFTRDNQHAAKPKWSLAQVHAFQRGLAQFRKSLNYEHQDLARALEYSVKYCRMMQGD